MKQILKDRAALVAFIYDHKTPPYAIVRPVDTSHAPFCVHSFRKGNLEFFTTAVEERMEQGEKDGPFEAWLDNKEYPETHTCLCDIGHSIRSAREHCTQAVEA